MYRGFLQRVIEFIKLDNRDLLEVKVKHPSFMVYASVTVLFLQREEAYSRGTDNYSGVSLSQCDF
jgi:hypothetical protein